METPRRKQIGLGLLAGGLALLWLAMLLLGDGPVDSLVLGKFYVGHIAPLAEVARFVTFVGGGYFVTAVIAGAALVLALRRRARLALLLLVGTSFGRILVELQKYEIGRLRPDANPHLVEIHSLSFPSAHAANSVMIYVTLALLIPAAEKGRVYWIAGACLLALIIGLTRLMLGVHWPSDVIGGWSFGLLWVLALYAIAEKFELRR